LESSPPSASTRSGNMLLDALPESERDRLLQHAKPHHLKIRHVLFEPNRVIRDVHFPLSGIVSLVTLMKDGDVVEMATIGREGVVGVPMALNGSLIPNAQGISQVEGDSLSISVEAFQEELARGGMLRSLVNEYVQALFSLVGQNAACNRLHSIQQRCARWLLLTQDRLESDEYRLTHEFLAQMLGSRRASVTQAAGALQDEGAIRYRRGVVTILDRAALEASACECYPVIKSVFDALSTGDPARSGSPKPSS
jgi:CRP-like cAMP-binding protein